VLYWNDGTTDGATCSFITGICSDGIAVKEDITPTAAQIAARKVSSTGWRSQMGMEHYLLF
jgi:hypothetical protein